MTMPQEALSAPSLCIRSVDGVSIVVLPAELGFEPLRALIRSQTQERMAGLSGRPLRLDLGDRDINLFDLRRLIHLLRDEFKADVSGLYCRQQAMHRFAERELKLKVFTAEPPRVPEAEPVPTVQPLLDEVGPPIVATATVVERPPEAELQAPPAEEPEAAPVVTVESKSEAGRRTLTVQRTLRSGASVRFDGDIVIFGDVNPGAQVEAAGNILVLGTLKGMAHAGATGDEKSFILGFALQPTQLRIGRRIAIPPERSPETASFSPEMATVLDGEIVIEAYRSPLPR